jgi:hypothetical protein
VERLVQLWLVLDVLGGILDHIGEIITIVTNREDLLIIVVSILSEHARVDIIGELQISLVLDYALLNQVNAMGNDGYFAAVKVCEHGPVCSFIFSHLSQLVWIFQMLKDSLLSIHLYYFLFCELSAPLEGIDNDLLLSKLQYSIVLDVPDRVVEANV